MKRHLLLPLGLFDLLTALALGTAADPRAPALCNQPGSACDQNTKNSEDLSASDFGKLLPEGEDIAELPIFTGGYTIVDQDEATCGGKIIDKTPAEMAAWIDTYELQAVGPVRLKNETFERRTSHTYDEDSGVSTPVKLESVTRSRTTVQTYRFVDDSGQTRLIDVSCSLACSGITCISSGCVPNGANCTAHSCYTLIAGYPCSGTCTKNSGGRPNPDNKF